MRRASGSLSATRDLVPEGGGRSYGMVYADESRARAALRTAGARGISSGTDRGPCLRRIELTAMCYKLAAAPELEEPNAEYAARLRDVLTRLEFQRNDMDFLPSGPLLSAFVLASLVLAIIPGPAVLYIVTRSLVQGRRSGLTSVVGVALGNLGNAIGASLGLAALFAVSSVAFTAVKYAGAAYLVYLGVQALRAPGAAGRRRSGVAGPTSADLPRWVRGRTSQPQDRDVLRPRSCRNSWIRRSRPSRRASCSVRCSSGSPASRTPPMRSRPAPSRRCWHGPGACVRPARYLSGGTFIGLGVLTAFGGPRIHGK